MIVPFETQKTVLDLQLMHEQRPITLRYCCHAAITQPLNMAESKTEESNTVMVVISGVCLFNNPPHRV